MKLIFSSFFFLLFCCCGQSQDLFKKGTIITWANDTINGAIRAPLKYTDLNRIEFKAKKDQLSYNVYSPLSLKSFHFEGGPYFASVRAHTPGSSSLRRRFAYIIAQGELDLYELPKYNKGEIKTFYTKRYETTALLGELSESKGKGYIIEGSYVEDLKDRTTDCDDKIEIPDDLKYKSVDLIKIVETFNESAGLNIQNPHFKTNLPAVMSYDLRLGYPFVFGLEDNADNRYGLELGLRYDFFKPGIINGLSFQTGIDYILNKQDIDDTSYLNHSIILPTLFQLYYKKKPVNPYFRIGPSTSFTISDRDENEGISLMWTSEVGLNLLDKFLIGLCYRSGNIDFTNHHYLTIQLSYILGRY